MPQAEILEQVAALARACAARAELLARHDADGFSRALQGLRGFLAVDDQLLGGGGREGRKGAHQGGKREQGAKAAHIVAWVLIVFSEW